VMTVSILSGMPCIVIHISLIEANIRTAGILFNRAF